jgi:hypothetical protein
MEKKIKFAKKKNLTLFRIKKEKKIYKKNKKHFKLFFLYVKIK